MNVTHPAVTQLLKQHEAMRSLDHIGRQAYMRAVEDMAAIPVAAALLAMEQIDERSTRPVAPDDHATHLHLAREAAMAEHVREAKIGARDMAGAYAARQALGGPMLGLGSIEAQELRGLAQSRDPGKMFSRSDILAIIWGQMAVAKARVAKDALGWVANIFENLE